MRLIGLVFVVGVLFAAPAAWALDMTIVGDQLIMTGDNISPGDVAKFSDRISEGKDAIKTVVFRNVGGWGDNGTVMRLSERIRHARVTTAVAGRCSGGCGVLFLGGLDRRPADQFPPDRTFVSFGGVFHSGAATAALEVQRGVRDWTIALADNKLDRQLVERWTSFTDRGSQTYFFDSTRAQWDGVSIFTCIGRPPEGERRKITDCEKIPGKTAYDSAIFTSSELVHVNDSPAK